MVEKYATDSGMTVILEPIDGVMSISAGLWVKVGSRHEEPSCFGYAHFIEHMLFKGTERYSAHDIARMVDRVGGQHNAATNREYTCYYINVINEHLPLTVELLADMYYCSLFDSEEIEKEKNVILEEIRMYEDTPDELIHDYFIESVLSGHPLAHPIVGNSENIRKITKKKLIDFFSNFYFDKNCLFVIAGNFNVDQAKREIDRNFNKKHEKKSITLLPTKIARGKSWRHIQRKLEQVHFCIGGEGVNRKDDDRWVLYVLSTYLGGSMSSRLFQIIREKEGLCYSIYSFHSIYEDTGLFGIYCGTSPQNFDRVIDLILNECRNVIEKGIPKQELEDTKSYIKGNIALSLESTEVRMGQLARNEMNYGRYISFQEIVECIDRVTEDDVLRVAHRLLREKPLTMVSIGNLNFKNTNFEFRI
ncbi:MAG: insulinase family protein [Spirochaetes bacterium]|nr:insulinase family protein [Spirochaetota bacterium]